MGPAKCTASRHGNTKATAQKLLSSHFYPSPPPLSLYSHSAPPPPPSTLSGAVAADGRIEPGDMLLQVSSGTVMLLLSWLLVSITCELGE